jgi:protein-tyrosine phosphatase
MDLNIISDTETLQIAKEVVNDLDNGKVIYLHCWGGHGRTGVIVCLVLHIKFGLTADEAIVRCQTCHDKRDYDCSNVMSPQTAEQRNQVRRIIGGLIVL